MPPLEPIDTDYVIGPNSIWSTAPITGETAYVTGATAWDANDYDIRRRALEFAIETAPRYDGSIGSEPHEIIETAELFRLFLIGDLEFIETAATPED